MVSPLWVLQHSQMNRISHPYVLAGCRLDFGIFVLSRRVDNVGPAAGHEAEIERYNMI